MKITLKKVSKADYKKVKRLYLKAFPKNERPPFFLLKRGIKKSRGTMLSAWDGEDFAGFCYLVCDGMLAYLFYFAIEEGKRGRGIGSAVLSELRRMYEGGRIFLAREAIDDTAENNEERIRRREFYQKNGFSDLTVKIKEGPMIYEVMSVGGEVSAAEYDALMYDFFGKTFCRLFDIRMI